MKLYFKYIDGVKVVKPSSKIVIIKDGMQVINPSQELLLEEGWEEYTYDSNETNKIDESIDSIILSKIEEVLKYKSSNEVKTFYINDNPIWFNKDTRVSLKLRYEIEKKFGASSVILWYNNLRLTINPDDVINILEKVELYAAACHDITQEHLKKIKSLNSIKEIKEYKFKDTYPPLLRFYMKENL